MWVDGPIRGSPGGSGASRSCGAGKGVAALRSKASAALHCSLFSFCCATEVVGDPWLGGPLDVGRMMLGGTAGPANHLVQNKLRGEQPAALTRILLTAGEVREALRVRYVADELTASRLLRERVSRSASGFMKMGLTRHIIRDELSELAGSRMQRAALCGIVCATGFKYFEGGGLLPTTRMRCEGMDSLGRLLECTGLQAPPPTGDPDPTEGFLAALARGASKIHTRILAPFREPTGGEAVLPMGTVSAGLEGGQVAIREADEILLALQGDSGDD